MIRQRCVLGDLLDDLTPEVLVDKPSAGELGVLVALSEGVSEGLLVVIESQSLWIVLRPHVHDDVASAEELRVTSANDGGIRVGREELEHGTRECLIAVELAVVGSDLHSLNYRASKKVSATRESRRNLGPA